MAKKKRMNPKIARAEDVEYSRELADQDDIEAQERGKAADARAKKRKNI